MLWQYHKTEQNVMNKFNQEGQRPVHWKLQYIGERSLKKVWIIWKILHIHGLEELAILAKAI